MTDSLSPYGCHSVHDLVTVAAAEMIVDCRHRLPRNTELAESPTNGMLNGSPRLLHKFRGLPCPLPIMSNPVQAAVAALIS